MKLYFAYDTSPISSVCECKAEYKYFFCHFLQKYIPVNGSATNSLLNFRRSNFYVSIEDVFKSLPYEVELKNVSEAIASKKPFIYCASIDLKKCTSFDTKFDNSLSEIFTTEFIECINSGRCLLCFDICEEIALSRYKRREEVFITLLEKTGIRNFGNIKFLTTIIYKNTFKPKIEPVLWDNFIRTYREKIDYNIYFDRKILSFKTNHGFRFLFLNNKLKFFRLLLFYLLYSETKDFKNQFIATLSPTKSFFYGEMISYNGEFKRVMDMFGVNNIPEILRSFYNINTTSSKIIASHKLKKLLKLRVPSYASDKVDVGNDIYRYTPEIQLLSGINIVTENTIDMHSSSDEGIFLTEKTYKPIAYKMPFIIYGQPFTLKVLHDKGFMTFNTLWSEEYDNIIDPLERAKEITRIVKEISFLSDDAFINLLTKAQKIVEYNYNHMMKNYDSEAQVKILFNNFTF
jgi:hypothetical protein